MSPLKNTDTDVQLEVDLLTVVFWHLHTAINHGVMMNVGKRYKENNRLSAAVSGEN